jgi:hypothetical protein
MLAALLVLARVGTANVVELHFAGDGRKSRPSKPRGIDPALPRGAALSAWRWESSLTVYLIIGALVSGCGWAFLQDVLLLAIISAPPAR